MDGSSFQGSGGPHPDLMSSPSPGDRPLSGVAYITLLAGAAGTILLFYFFVLSSILVLLVILAFEITLFLTLARFGLFRIMTPTLKKHGGLLGLFIRSLKLGKSNAFRIPIKAEDAPELRAILAKICAKAKVPLPRKVYLEMGVNAWVQMKGYGRGSGTTILGIGYDLLAGLSQVEMEGVLAHEMMHAKLVQRGFRQLLTGGILRAAQLTNRLAAQLAISRRAKQSENLAALFASGADRLTRMAARQVAACSRQDEFAADRGAAELCGAGAICSSLLKLEGLNRIAARLQMRERIAQLESGESFGEWMIRELAAAPLLDQAEAKAQAFNKYSTHPSLHDRLAALTAFPDQTLPESPSALGLLARPDEVAEKLVGAIQKQVVEQEQRDSKQLDRWSRRTSSSREVQPLQLLGMFLGVAGLIGGICTLAAPWPWNEIGVLTGLAILAAGIVILKKGGYREKASLPVPDYGLLKAVSQKKIQVTDEQVKAIEAELRHAALGQTPKEKLPLYLSVSHRALEQCDYLRAHIAARFCLEQNKKSIPGTLALAVAAGGLKLGQQVGQAIHFVRRRTGMKGASPAWGAGWALALAGDWIHAEAFLEQARAQKPESATVLAMLAVSQSKRGKLFTAIASARKASALQPADMEYSKLLVDLLLQGGFLREARHLLAQLVDEAVTDTELTLSMVKLSLLQRDEATAQAWIELVRASAAGPKKFVTLGEACAAARQDHKAAEHFQLALVDGHYPEALLGLGRLEASRQNREQAGNYFLAALDLHRPLGENSVGPLPLVGPLLQHLKSLHDPILNCRGWIAALPGTMKPSPLAGVSFLIYATDSDEAKKWLDRVLKAMQPGGPPPPSISWRPAPKEQQPDGPVHPGVQAVLN
jgi:Zn-dependent protease with chaperone function